MQKAKSLCAVAEKRDDMIINKFEKESGSHTGENVISIDSVVNNGLKKLVGNDQNIVIKSVGDEEVLPDSITRLAVELMDNDELIRESIHELRTCIISKQKNFSISIDKWSRSERKRIYELFQDLAGVVSNLSVSSNYKTISGILNLNHNSMSFITGKYLEIAIYEVIKSFLAEFAQKYQMTYEIYRNVTVATREGKLKNEFDIVIVFNNILYAVEVKSGKFFSDWECFIETGRTYNIIPDRLLLVDSYLSEEKASRIEYFCNYYVSNLNIDYLRSKLERMLLNDIDVWETI